MRRILIASIAVGAIITGLLLATPASDAPQEERSDSVSQAGTTRSPTLHAAADRPAQADGLQTPPQAPLRPLADTSLFGSDPDGEVRIDEWGALIKDAALRRLFDYFLSLTGEMPLHEIERHVAEYLRQNLPADAAAQGLALWKRYLNYREASRELYDDDTLADASIAEQLDAMAALREGIFGAEDAAGLFGDEQQTQRVDLERYRVLKDPNLSAEEQRQQVAALEDMLPPSVRAARAASRVHLDLRAAESGLMQSGGDAAALRGLRERMVGTQAADRLEALGQARNRWQQRVRNFTRAIKDLEALGGDEASREALLNNHFVPHERLRVRALLRNNTTPLPKPAAAGAGRYPH